MSHSLMIEETVAARHLVSMLNIYLELGLELPESVMRALDSYKSARDALAGYDAERRREFLEETWPLLNKH